MAYLAAASAAHADGRFIGDVVAKWLSNGRDMELSEPFAYVDTKGREWSVPKGATVDGASIPRALWTIIGPPFTGKYRKASVVHDYFSATMARPWREVHEMFFQAAVTEGNSVAHSKLMYGAVYAWGPRWEYVNGKPIKTREMPHTPTEEQVKSLFDWISAGDPTLDAIAAFADQTFPRTRPQEQNRVALVIGNSAYLNTPKLPNPANDAADVARLFRGLGYKVILGLDLDKGGMDRHVREFSEALGGSEAGVFFYAGHGLQVNGQNYLVPIDAKLERASGLDFEMVRLDLVQRSMEAEGKTNIIFLDACRDNPLARNLARALGTRSTQIGRGLAAVESGAGTLISFSTQPGNVALDGSGRNSPYSEALVKHIEEQALKEDLSSLLIAVRRDVMAATKSKQVPWEHSALTARFFVGPHAETQIEKPQPQQYDKEMEIIFWNAVKDSKDADVLGSYLERYPAGNFARLAEILIARLKREALAEKAVREKEDELRRAQEATKLAEAKRAEEQRKLDELRRKEQLDNALQETRRAQEAAKQAEAERAAAVAKAAEAERVAAEAKRAQEVLALKEAELRKLEDAKKAAEAKRAEDQRRLDEAKAQELTRARDDARKAQEAAKAAEDQRQAALRAAEEARNSAEAAKKAQDAALRKQEAEAEVKRLAEQHRLDEERDAALVRQQAQAEERQRVAALALKAEEEAKLAEAQRLTASREAAEARKAADLAKQKKEEEDARALEEQRAAAVQIAPPSRDAQADQKTLVRAIQTELRRVGCDAGEADGQWGARGKAALEEFSRRVNLAKISGDPTAEVLQAIVAQKGRVCPLVCGFGKTLVGSTCVAKDSGSAAQKAKKEPVADLPGCNPFGTRYKCRNGQGQICTAGGGMVRCD